MTLRLDRTWVRDLVRRALKEDLGPGDITSRAIVKKADQLRGMISVQAKGVVAGLPLVKEVYRQLDPKVKVRFLRPEASQVAPGDRLATVAGPAIAVLSGERLALNFLGMMSGIASLTNQYVQALEGTKTKVYDTRKTSPGLRHLAKYAVLAGGGVNHRMGLYDAALIKDNHIALSGTLTDAINRFKSKVKSKYFIEVEAEDLSQVKEALAQKVDVILLDNLNPTDLAQAIQMINGKAVIEVSGGMNLETARQAAALGVDRVSIGALTHSAPWLALHMEVE